MGNQCATVMRKKFAGDRLLWGGQSERHRHNRHWNPGRRRQGRDRQDHPATLGQHWLCMRMTQAQRRDPRTCREARASRHPRRQGRRVGPSTAGRNRAEPRSRRHYRHGQRRAQRPLIRRRRPGRDQRRYAKWAAIMARPRTLRSVPPTSFRWTVS